MVSENVQVDFFSKMADSFAISSLTVPILILNELSLLRRMNTRRVKFS